MGIGAASREALSRLCCARPRWTGVQPARGAVGPMAGIISPGMPVLVVEDEAHGARACSEMCAAKATARAIEGIAGSTVVSAMARNGVEFGIRVAGLGDRWFTGPASRVVGTYFPSFGDGEANPDIGDSAIMETYGLGGMAMAASPAVIRIVGARSFGESLSTTRTLPEICADSNPLFAIAALDGEGAPTGIDIRKVVETGITPAINTAIAHRDGGRDDRRRYRDAAAHAVPGRPRGLREDLSRPRGDVAMPVRAVVWRSHYQDSVVLMRVAAALRALPGVREAAALMGTPANHELLASAGLATPDTKDAAPGDLMLAVDAETDGAAEAALAAARGLLEDRRRAREATGRVQPRTLDSALRQMPDANLVAISVPGVYAKLEAMRALRRGLHVFLFSDNVSLEDEIELKRAAVRRRLLCMGPDCGTAYLNGVGLGFANVVPPGRVGCVAASGTGLQAVASRVAALGEGISHGIGVGGRDLSAPVNGAMTRLALEALAADPATEVVVLVSKPPDAGVMRELEGALSAVGKPVVACCLGAVPRAGGPARWVTTLEDAAEAAVALLRARPWTPRPFSHPETVRAGAAELAADAGRRGPGLLGLYTGGTLGHEARLILESLLGPVGGNLGDGGEAGPHRLLDLGADEFTVGRPHPMLDPEARAARVRDAGRSPAVGVLLLDLVLGRGAHESPAQPLAQAIEDARSAAARDGRSLVAVASVVGTERDPQGLGTQIGALEAAGAVVLPSNAQAARFAALAVKPELGATLLAGAS